MVPVLIAVVAFSGVLSNIEGAIALLARIYARVKKAVLPHAAAREQSLALAGYSDIESVLSSNSRRSSIRLSKGSTAIPHWTGTNTLGALSIIILLGVVLAIGNIGQDPIGILASRGLNSSVSTITIHVAGDPGEGGYVSIGGRVDSLLQLSPDTEVVVFERQGTGAPPNGYAFTGWSAVGRTTPTADGSWAIVTPAYLNDQPGLARTIIEKSEQSALSKVDAGFAIALMTPTIDEARSNVHIEEKWASHSSVQLSAAASPGSAATTWTAPAFDGNAPPHFQIYQQTGKKSPEKGTLSDGRISFSEFTAVLAHRDTIPLGTHTDTLEQLRPRVLSSFAPSVCILVKKGTAQAH